MKTFFFRGPVTITESEDNKLEIFHKNDHYMLTDIQWDPSSR